MQVLVALLFIILIEVPVNAKIPAVAGRFEIKNIHEYKIKAPQVKAQLRPETESELNKIIDDNLRSCVQEQTTNLDSLSELTKLNCANRDIKNLDGIAALDNLQTLNLRANQIKYVSPLEDLAKLEDINLSKNKIATGIQSLGVISNLKILNLTDNPRLYCREIRDFYFYDEDNSGFQLIHNCRNSPPVSKLSFADPHLMNKLFINENTKADRLYHLSNKRWNGKRTVLNPLTNLSGIEQLINLSTLELYGRDNTTRQLNLSPLSKVLHLTRLRLDKLPVAQWDWNLPRLTTLSVGRIFSKETIKDILEATNESRLDSLDDLNFYSLPNKLSYEINNHPNLGTLFFDNAEIATLKLSNNSALSIVGVSNSRFDSIEIDSIPELRLSSVRLVNLETISPIDNLQSFSCDYCEIQSLQGFPSNGSSLVYLALYNSNLTSLNGLPASMPNLSSLMLENSNLTSLNGLPASMPNLSSLMLNNSNLTSLNGLPTSMPNLSSLILEYNKLTSLNGLNLSASNSNFYLDLSYNAFTNLNFINHLNGSILNLSAVGNMITSNGFTLLDKPNLKIRQLYLYSNKIKDISWLDGLIHNNVTIDLDNNQIQDLSSLVDLPYVINGYQLYLRGNQITRTANFLHSNNGGSVYLDNNQISDLDFLLDDRGINLTNLSLHGNQIDDEDIKIFSTLAQNTQNLRIGTLSLGANLISDFSSINDFLRSRLNDGQYKFYDLSYNRISKITNQSLLANGLSLNLECNLISKLGNYDISGKNIGVSLSFNQITEVGDLSLSGSDVYLNLSNNQILTVSNVDLDGNVTLVLSMNKIKQMPTININQVKEDLHTLSLIYLDDNHLQEMPIINVTGEGFSDYYIDAKRNNLKSIRKLIDNLKAQQPTWTATFSFRGNPDLPKSQIKELRDLGYSVYD